MIFRKLLLKVERDGDPATSATQDIRGYVSYPLSYVEPEGKLHSKGEQERVKGHKSDEATV